MSSESAGNLGSCGSPRVITTFCNPRSRTRLCRPCKYLVTTSSAMMRPWGPTTGDSRTAAARTNVCDGHPGFDAKQAHELGWFTGIVALLFVVPDRTDYVCDRAIGFWKGDSWSARSRQEFLRRDRDGECSGKDGGNCHSHHVTCTRELKCRILIQSDDASIFKPDNSLALRPEERQDENTKTTACARVALGLPGTR